MTGGFDGRAMPRIRGNDHGVLEPPALGRWEPRLTVSVVIPAHRSQATLDLTLAALAAQSYPAHLLEVIVVDDGSDPPLRLPAIAPARTRLVPAEPGGWGAAWACQTGVRLAEGDIVHRLDSDVVPYREHVEALMRWHHLADYLVVTGTLRFTEEALPPPGTVREAVDAGWAGKLFDWKAGRPHVWVEEQGAKTRGLRDAPVDAFKTHVGATASVPAWLYDAAGGMDPALPLGEDTEFGYRLAQRGAVFLRDPDALAWHVGAHTMR
jgi:GT2 family glycosyltransferase